MTTIRTIDLETQNHKYLGAVASPHCPENYIVQAGWRDDINAQVGKVEFRHFLSRTEAEDPANPWFNLEGVDLLIAHNAMYEMSWFITRYRAEFEKFLLRGGRVLCTQLAEYILSDFTWTYPPLDEVAPKHGGTHKVDGVKILWEQGVLTADIDPELLKEYLVGPNGDVENTALVFYSQMQQLIARGQWRMFLERCEGMLAFSYCEASGLYVNQEVAAKNHKAQLEELAAIDLKVNKLLPVLPEHLAFNWGSDFHLSALLFGGAVKYQHRVPQTTVEGDFKYEKDDFYKFGDSFIAISTLLADPVNPEAGVSPTLFEAYVTRFGAADRYKSGKNKGQLKVHRNDTEVVATKWEDTQYQFPGCIQLPKLPAVLRDKFIGRRPEYAGKRFLVCGTPVYSTSGEVLDALAAHGFDAAKLLSRRAQLDKDNSTYYWAAEYAKERQVGKKSIRDAVALSQPAEDCNSRTQTEPTTEVWATVGGLAGNADGLSISLPDLPEVISNGTSCTSGDKGSTRPLPRDGEGSGCSLPHMQQSVGDGGGQLSGNTAFCAVPKVGINGCTKVKGMLQYVGADSIIHHNLNTCATVTGRLSASNPNLQNLPRDGTSRVKEMFTSRFGEHGQIIEVDYSALEVVMLAALSGDQGLLAHLQKGTDMHCLRLAAKLDESYEEVVRKCNDHNDPDHKRYKQMRTDIKSPSFAAQYGASARGIAFATGVTEQYAQEFLDTEARLFPRAIEYRQVIRDEVTRTGLFPEGLQREFNEDSSTWTVYRRGYWQAPGGTRYSFRQYQHYRNNESVMDYKDTQIANYWCQGESGFMMTLSAGRVIRWLLSKGFFGGKCFLINNVHDALYFDCHNDFVREVGLAGSAIMADAPNYMSTQLGYSIAHVPFPAKAEAGASMYSKEEIV